MKMVNWAICAGPAVAGLMTLPVSPALANGSRTVACKSDEAIAAQSSQALGGAQTFEDLNVCGNVGARVVYHSYPGGSTYFGSWKYATHAVFAAAPQSTSVDGGRHDCTQPAFVYDVFPIAT